MPTVSVPIYRLLNTMVDAVPEKFFLKHRREQDDEGHITYTADASEAKLRMKQRMLTADEA